jgi:hypothetical protein
VAAPAPVTTTRSTPATESSVRTPLTIDLRAHPNLQFRIDAFTEPAASPTEF